MNELQNLVTTLHRSVFILDSEIKSNISAINNLQTLLTTTEFNDEVQNAIDMVKKQVDELNQDLNVAQKSTTMLLTISSELLADVMLDIAELQNPTNTLTMRIDNITSQLNIIKHAMNDTLQRAEAIYTQVISLVE